MQKTRINLAEAYPTYHATAELSEKFAELTDMEIERLDKIEAALNAKTEAPVEENVEPNASASNPAPVASTESEENAQLVALLERVTELENKLNKKPAAAATVIEDDLRAEGDQSNPKKSYACAIDEELAKFNN